MRSSMGRTSSSRSDWAGRMRLTSAQPPQTLFVQLYISFRCCAREIGDPRFDSLRALKITLQASSISRCLSRKM